MKNLFFKYITSIMFVILMVGNVIAAPDARVSAGNSHALFLDVDNNVLAMGHPRWGETGPHALHVLETYKGMAPIHVGIKANIITAGFARSAAVRVTDGSILIWGQDEERQPNGTPKPIPGNFTGVKDIALTVFDLFFIANTGELYRYKFDHNEPTPLGIFNVVELASNYNHLLILNSSGDVYALGDNTYGKLGLGDNEHRVVPTLIPNIKAKSIGVGSRHSLVVLTDGTVVAFGHNREGMLGDGTEIDSNVPVAVVGLFNVKQVVASRMGSYALMDDGTVYGWGWHNYIGNGAYNRSYTPVMIIELSEITSISAQSSAFSTADTYNIIRGFVSNAYGMLGDGTSTERHVPVMTLSPTGVENIEVLPLEPVIASVEPGGSYLISGENFGDELGTVSVDGTLLTVISWEDTFIHIENPDTQLTGVLTVTTADGLVAEGVLVTLEPDAPIETVIPDAVVVECDKPGYGYGDKNHRHCGPPGLIKQGKVLKTKR